MDRPYVLGIILLLFIAMLPVLYRLNLPQEERNKIKERKIKKGNMKRSGPGIILPVISIILLFLLSSMILLICSQDNLSKSYLLVVALVKSKDLSAAGALGAFYYACKIFISALSLLVGWMLADWISGILKYFEGDALQMKKPLWIFASRVSNFFIKATAIFISAFCLGINIYILVGIYLIGLISAAIYNSKNFELIFAGLTISKDPPFEMYDTITVGELSGTVIDFTLTHTTVLINEDNQDQKSCKISNKYIVHNSENCIWVDSKKNNNLVYKISFSESKINGAELAVALHLL